MKQYFLFSLVTCMLLAGSSCNKDSSPETGAVIICPITPTVKQFEKVTDDNTFSFHLFRQTVLTTENSDNAFISPISVSMALGMLYNGTSGTARTEMAEALKPAGFTDAEFNEYYQMMATGLPKVDPTTTLRIANSIWYEETYSVKQSFFDTNREYFDAEVRALDFAAPASVDVINGWCAEKTENKIEEIIESIPGDAVMYLINAVYFNSKWQTLFDKNNSHPAKFTMAGGTQTDVTMMEQTTTLPYYADDNLRCVEIPYANETFSMAVLLPAEGKDLESVIASLDGDNWQKISSGLYEQNIHLKLPRFKQECNFQLKEPVTGMGMGSIFECGNLLEIADDDQLYVSKIIHKTFVEVKEEGTEAAAVTAVEVSFTSIDSSGTPAPPIPFYADQPFVYLIKEKSTGAILFIGRMDHPKE